MQEILVKQADNSSLRTTNAMPKNYTEIARKDPGNLRIVRPFSNYCIIAAHA